MPTSKRDLLLALLNDTKTSGYFPSSEIFRLAHERDRRVIDEMANVDGLLVPGPVYTPTLKGLRLVKEEAFAREELERVALLAERLKAVYRQRRRHDVEAEE